jgi:hypothetical protein
MLRLDHVIWAADDLDAEAERWRRTYGLDAVDGGRHARWGTANRIVPLGDDYIEIAGVVDPDEARGNAFGRALLERAGSWLGPVVATDDLDAIAARLALGIGAGARRRPDGAELRWRSAGFDDPRREWWMPFFIAWNIAAELHPGRAGAAHRARPHGIASVAIAGDADRLRSWTGTADLPFVVTPGAGEVRTVVVATDDGELEIA